MQTIKERNQKAKEDLKGKKETLKINKISFLTRKQIQQSKEEKIAETASEKFTIDFKLITKNNFDDNIKTQSTTKLERYLEKDDDDTNNTKS